MDLQKFIGVFCDLGEVCIQKGTIVSISNTYTILGSDVTAQVADWNTGKDYGIDFDIHCIQSQSPIFIDQSKTHNMFRFPRYKCISQYNESLMNSRSSDILANISVLRNNTVFHISNVCPYPYRSIICLQKGTRILTVVNDPYMLYEKFKEQISQLGIDVIASNDRCIYKICSDLKTCYCEMKLYIEEVNGKFNVSITGNGRFVIIYDKALNVPCYKNAIVLEQDLKKYMRYGIISFYDDVDIIS